MEMKGGKINFFAQSIILLSFLCRFNMNVLGSIIFSYFYLSLARHLSICLIRWRDCC